MDDTKVVFVYADEDYRGRLGELYDIEDDLFDEEVTRPYRIDDCTGFQSCARYRGEPWFKPDFSPDTFASFFYVGSVFAVRGGRMLEITGKYGSDISIYELVYRIFMEALEEKKWMDAEKIIHIPKVLYTNDSLADAERIDDSEKIRALYYGDSTQNVNMCLNKVSIVIPSKDNAVILQKCLETLTQYTDYDNYEIIIVDNGSNAEQKNHIMNVMNGVKENKNNKDLVIQYLYQKMEFNFSAMCNMGARSAHGAYLLFLNDDIEVMDTAAGRQWLDKMMAYAKKSHVGAVGAKLYYPPRPEENGCYRIQHAGITNMGIGPAHKLGGMTDSGCMYHGHNTQNYDMLAVTAACMLIRKNVFDEIGGFDETFPVAYNDVELCFRLYQRGYFNIQVNEAVLIHHESISRGQDTSPEKQRRLAGEKERLCQKHELLKAKDPFYSPNLVQWKKDAAYSTGYLYDFDRHAVPVLLDNDSAAAKRKQAVFQKYDIRNLLHAKWGLAAKIYDRLTGYHDIMFQIDRVCYGDGITDGQITDNNITDNNITIEGWYVVRNMDNANLSRKLWLIYETRTFDFRNVYEFEIAPKLREDVAKLLEGDGSQKETAKTKNTSLSGIQVNIAKGILKPGTYRIGVLCRNRLVCDMEKWVKVGDTGDKHRKV